LKWEICYQKYFLFVTEDFNQEHSVL
jgi:hypothetical protein